MVTFQSGRLIFIPLIKSQSVILDSLQRRSQGGGYGGTPPWKEKNVSPSSLEEIPDYAPDSFCPLCYCPCLYCPCIARWTTAGGSASVMEDSASSRPTTSKFGNEIKNCSNRPARRNFASILNINMLYALKVCTVGFYKCFVNKHISVFSRTTRDN